MSVRDYRYTMGFAVDGKPIPDPSGFSGSDSSLDTSAERDANGLLHRAMVATKHPLKIEWRNIEWNVITSILQRSLERAFNSLIQTHLLEVRAQELVMLETDRGIAYGHHLMERISERFRLA